MPKFSIGDRVMMAVIPNSEENSFIEAGLHGTVVEISHIPFVKWDEHRDCMVRDNLWCVPEERLHPAEPQNKHVPVPRREW